MSYIIIWNPNCRDIHVHMNARGFIETFDNPDDAIEEAKECQDNEQFRDFCLYSESKEHRA